MEQFERGAAIESLTQLESYYQSKYEYYLAMATEAKENKERVGLLLLDLGRDVLTAEDNSIGASLSNGRELTPDKPWGSGSASHRNLDNQWVNLKLPQAEPERESPASSSLDKKRSASSSAVEQMRRWTLDLSQAMSVIESVSNSDSGKALHQNYLHHLLNRELDIELTFELVELYLEEATRRGYLEPDEFNNDCYIAGAKDDSLTEASRYRSNMDSSAASDRWSRSPSSNIATPKATHSQEQLSGRESGKPYDLPESDKLKPTLFETIEGYIESNRPKRFSIDDVVNYLYPQPIQSNWDKVQRNKVRTSISNVLSRKAYLGKHWSRIKPGVYRPRTSK